MEAVESKNKYNIPIWHKYCLTIEEAVAYSGIGENKLRDIVKYNCPFAIYKGNHTIIKRVQFEKWIDAQSKI